MHDTVMHNTGATVGKGQARGEGRGRNWKKITTEVSEKARGDCHERLENIMMQSRDDADDFVYIVEGYRDRTEESGQLVPRQAL